MVPEPRGLADVERAVAEIDHRLRVAAVGGVVPVHVPIKTHGALREVDAIAAHPRIESLSFGLMDFVSAHRGAILAAGVSASGQFTHPLVLRAKLEIAAACHAHWKVPSHCVVTEFNDAAAIAAAARCAARELGYTGMWSIHPNQVRAIVEAFAPDADETARAIEILMAAQAAEWAPIRHADTLHNRASYRYFWQVLERAQRTGRPLPDDAMRAFFAAAEAATA